MNLNDIVEWDEENRWLTSTNRESAGVHIMPDGETLVPGGPIELGATMIVARDVEPHFARRVVHALEDGLYDRGVKAGAFAALAGFRRVVIRESGTTISIDEFVRMIEVEMRKL